MQKETFPIDQLLNLKDAKVISVKRGERGDFYFLVETTEDKVNCHQCGKEICKLHGKDKIRTVQPALTHQTINPIKKAYLFSYKLAA